MNQLTRSIRAGNFLKAISFAVLLTASSFSLASSINVNTATQTELESIRGVGPSKAKTIIAERLDGGHFQDAQDLHQRVRGIGMKSVEKMMNHGLTIEAPSSFREPHGRSKKTGTSARKRHSRSQNHSDSGSNNAQSNYRN
jgi:competence protein ComEA|uniref:ComEA family DNA-binding protein n=1 Tax=Polynucleobacter sp. TaxID=2029855 RepID=UPI0040474498